MSRPACRAAVIVPLLLLLGGRSSTQPATTRAADWRFRILGKQVVDTIEESFYDADVARPWADRHRDYAEAAHDRETFVRLTRGALAEPPDLSALAAEIGKVKRSSGGQIPNPASGGRRCPSCSRKWQNPVAFGGTYRQPPGTSSGPYRYRRASPAKPHGAQVRQSGRSGLLAGYR